VTDPYYQGRHRKATGKEHVPGNCWCSLTHTVQGAEELNRAPVYDAMIKRAEGEPDPLIQEP
jgi:hypothetical protein